jgi:hypothetical protein
MSLVNLSSDLAAITAIQEAVDIRRELASALPDAFRPDLAKSLNNLSSVLAKRGRREDALTAIQEAVDILGGLPVARPDVLRDDFASTLNHRRLITLRGGPPLQNAVGCAQTVLPGAALPISALSLKDGC